MRTHSGMGKAVLPQGKPAALIRDGDQIIKDALRKSTVNLCLGDLKVPRQTMAKDGDFLCHLKDLESIGPFPRCWCGLPHPKYWALDPS